MSDNLNSEEYREKMQVKLAGVFKKEEKSIVGFFIKNFRFTYLIILAILSVGFYSVLTLPREAEPEVKVPFANVVTIYPGATPTDIEELITDKIEEEVSNLYDLNKYSSVSSQGVSSVHVEFNAEANLKDSFQKLREAVDRVEAELPEEAETPQVIEINFNDVPIVTYSLVGNYDDTTLKNLADMAKDEFESIKDVSKAVIVGGLEREFQIIVDQTKLVNFNISLGQIIRAVQMNNFNLPVGNIEIDDFKYDIRVQGKFEEITELSRLTVATYDNSPVFLSDIAVIKDSYKEKETDSFIGFPNEASRKTISLQLYKKTGGNILNIVKNSNNKIDELYANNKLPADLIIEKTNDNSVFIKDDLTTLGQSGIQTFILINLILLLVLSFRGALITAISVPLAFLASFVFLYLQDMTLNSMVLFSLVISLGLMVDNAIIIIEGINEYISEYKKTVYEAAILSVWNFKWAITAGTMTTVAAFLPMLLVSGIMGEYMSILPKTISVTLLSSLFVAIVVIPTLAVRFIKVENHGAHSTRNKKRHVVISGWIKKLHKIYIKFLREVLPNKKKRVKIIIIAWVLFAVAILAPISGFMSIEMFPKIDLDFFVVNIELPVGSTLDITKETTKKIENIINKIPELDNYVTNVGFMSIIGYHGGNSSGTHLSNIYANLVEKDNRDRKSYEIADEIRLKLDKIVDARVTVEELSAGPPTGAPIEVRIFGDDLEGLAKTIEEVKSYFKNVLGVINIKDSMEDAAGEFVFTVDRQKVNYYGLDIATIATTLRNAVYGTKASVVNLDGDDVDITVKYDKTVFNNLNDLENILLFTPRGNNVPLKELAKVDLEPSLLNINHRDGKKIATVSASLEKGVSLQEILKDFEKKQETIKLPAGFSIKVGGEVEDIQKSFTELFLSMIIAVVLIALILVLQFNSFKQPFIIILSVPLAIIGVMIGLNILRQPFSFTAFIGLVSLAGIVVNDAIVLIDRINKNIKQGMEFYEAIIEGGVARMQPIFLTSLTTIAGIFPLIYASELWRGLSLTVIFGLLSSTVLILIMVPIYFASMCKSECFSMKENKDL